MKRARGMDMDHFLELIKKAAKKDTSYDKVGWSKENPLWGHCVMVALLAQKIYGGKIMRGSLEGIPAFEIMRSHYWNHIPGEGHRDFTIEQFGGNLPKLLPSQRGREKILAYPGVKKRYLRFVSRFEKLLKN